MPKFRRRPVVVEAFRLGEYGRPTPALYWFPSPRHEDIRVGGIIIHTLEGPLLASWGDWIIKGIKGEIYPCKPDIFEATYERVDD